ncbi:MAG: hypothetical protein AABX30_02330 [Nanoarchaeota archaeon]
MVNLCSKIPSGFLQTKFRRYAKMKAKNILVSFIAIATILSMIAVVSASDVTSEYSVKVDNEYVMVDGVAVGSDFAVVTDDTVSVKVVFTSDVNASDIKIKAEIEGQKKDVEEITAPFDVETGKRYSKTLNIKIPSELKDDLSDDYTLNIRIYNKDYSTDVESVTLSESVTLRVQREPYNVNVMSVSTSQNIEAGQTLPVDIVLKNVGYNELDDLYVTLSIQALGAERTGYFGDLVELEDLRDNSGERVYDDDEEDTVSGRIYLEIPENAKAGTYTLEVEVSNDDLKENAVKEIKVANAFSGSNVIASVTSKTVAAGEDAEYSILIVNPTSKLKVYRVVPETSADLSVNVDETVIAVPAGSSKTVKVTANSATEGTYNFNVAVFAGEELVNQVALSAKVEGSKTVASNPIVVLTIVLAIIFIVLLVVLIVLLGKKPEKSEELSESYY